MNRQWRKLLPGQAYPEKCEAVFGQDSRKNTGAAGLKECQALAIILPQELNLRSSYAGVCCGSSPAA